MSLAFVLLLAACGFQLQGGDSWPRDWRGYSLEFAPRDAEVRELADLLDDAMRRRSLRPASDGQMFRLELLNVTDRKVISAIGADGKAVEFELQRNLAFVVRAQEFRSGRMSATASRRYSFDPAILLAKEAEEDRLQGELSREVAELALLQVESQLRRWSTAAASAIDDSGQSD